MDVPSIERRIVAVRRRPAGEAAAQPRPAESGFWSLLDRVDGVLAEIRGAGQSG